MRIRCMTCISCLMWCGMDPTIPRVCYQGLPRPTKATNVKRIRIKACGVSPRIAIDGKVQGKTVIQMEKKGKKLIGNLESLNLLCDVEAIACEFPIGEA